MNYNYKNIFKKDSQSHNSYLIYKGNIEGINVQVHAYVGVPLNEVQKRRIINLQFYCERADDRFVDNYLHEMTDDISNLIKEEYKDEKMFSVAFCSYFVVDKLTNVTPITFGDYNID